MLLDEVTVFTHSGLHIFSIRSLTPLAYGMCRSLRGVSLSKVVIVGVVLPLKLFFTTAPG